MTTEERYQHIIDWFQVNVPEAKSELDFRSPYELLVAVILSAQCTDKRVNMTTPALLEAFPTADVLAATSPEVVYTYIKSISYPNNKAKSLVGMAQKLVSDFEGKVPDTMEELLTLPGVGRKTASVLLICAFDKPAMPVDTHVFRVSNRLGLTDNAKSPEETEKILLAHIPERLLPIAHHWLILHGRYICQARKPLCGECGLMSWCKYQGH
ncbi:MAG: endonuclease III [Bacteroidales bacterium]|nr:endonuclease III [Bacteroidales bacterium]